MLRRNTESIADVIKQVLRENKLDKPLNEKRLMDAWPLVLGQNIVQYTTELCIKNRVLYVTMNSSVLRHDLFLSREEIKNSLNKKVGVEVINEVVFR